jgi:probable HAF family extracellular repeat protein
MNFQIKMIGVLLVGLLGLASLPADIINDPPRYRLQRIEEWENYTASGKLLLNNRNQLAALVTGEDGLHFFIRGRNRTVEIPLPPEAALWSDSLQDFNNNGVALFWQSGNHAAYRYRRGKFVNLTNFLPYKYFNPVAINDRGHIVGGAQRDESSPITPFSYYRGRHRELTPLLPGTHALALAINNRGAIVGAAQRQTNEMDYLGSSFLWVFFKKGPAQGIAISIGGSSATGINDRGVVIGRMQSKKPFEEEFTIDQGFVYGDDGQLLLRPLFGHLHTRAESINRRGLIVGYSADEDFKQTAVLFRNGATYNLNDLIPPDSDAALSVATSINDRGVIAARNENGEVFLLFPE